MGLNEQEPQQGLNMEDLLWDCTDAMVNRRQSSIRAALRRYKYEHTAPEKYGRSTPEERKLLENAMRNYKEFATTLEQKRAYNILLYYYFSTKQLTDVQMAKLFKIERRTVHKCIHKGVSDLALFIYGAGGLSFQDREPTPWSTMEEEVLYKFRTPEALLETKAEVLKTLRAEFATYIRENPEIDLIAEMEAMDAWFKEQKSAAAAKAEHMSREKEEKERLWEEWYPYIKAALDAIRKGKATPEVKEILTKAMETYKGAARWENQIESYNILQYYFFSSQPPTGQQAARKFNIAYRTVYKRIKYGTYNLTPFIYRIKGAAEVLGKIQTVKEVKNQ